MWKNNCQEISNLETLENLFIKFYGEEYQELIHEKLSKTSFIFISNNDYVAHCNIASIFPNNKDININQIREMSKDINLDPKNILKYMDLIEDLGYNRNEILNKNIILRKFTPGNKYNELISKLDEVKSILPKQLPSVEEKVFKDFQQEHSNIDIKSTKSLHRLLESQNDLDTWKQNPMTEQVYVRQFNNAFGTNFKSIEAITKHSRYNQVIQDIEHSRELYIISSNRQTETKYDNIHVISNDNETLDRAKENEYGEIIQGCSGFALPQFLDRKGTIMCDVVVKIDENTAFSTIIHELTHTLQAHQLETGDAIFGFDKTEGEDTDYLNEIFTEYLTTQMMIQIPDEEYSLPFPKDDVSPYKRGFAINGDFLKTYENVIKQCTISANPEQVMLDNFGDNYYDLKSLVNRYMQINEQMYISHINNQLGTSYSYIFDIIKNQDTIREHFSNNEKMLDYLDIVNDLYSLNKELVQEQSSQISL